jgi:hypothetical protein
VRSLGLRHVIDLLGVGVALHRAGGGRLVLYLVGDCERDAGIPNVPFVLSLGTRLLRDGLQKEL